MAIFDRARNTLKRAAGVDKSLSELKPVNTERRAKILTRGNKHSSIIFFLLRLCVMLRVLI